MTASERNDSTNLNQRVEEAWEKIVEHEQNSGTQRRARKVFTAAVNVMLGALVVAMVVGFLAFTVYVVASSG